MSWSYDSGGHHKDQGKYAESFKNIFKTYDAEGNCVECGSHRSRNHKMDCTKNWRNK